MRPKKNPVTKLIGAGVKAAAKAAGKNVKPSLKAAKKAKPLANPKSGVRVKPAAKQQPNKPNETKMVHKINESGGRAYNKAAKEYEAGAGRHGNMYEMQDAARDAMFRAPAGRKVSITGKKLSAIEKNKATTPQRSKDTAWSTKKAIKINSAPKKK